MYKVYEIRTNCGRVYIGCTKLKLSARLAVHKYQQKPFVLQPYSVTIVFETESCDNAHKFEAELIAKYDSTNPSKGYNRRFGGSRYSFPEYVDMSRNVAGSKNPMAGRSHSEQAKEKIRQSTLARDPSTFEAVRHKTEEQIAKLQAGRERFQREHAHPMSGKTHSEEARKKISEKMKGQRPWLGRKHSPETLEKMRAAQKLWRLNKKLKG